MPNELRSLPPPPPIVAIMAWMLPGLGYWLIGQRSRAITVGATIITLYILGLLIGGIRVVDVPGFDENGARARDVVNRNAWALTSSPIRELRDKPWSILQMLNGTLFLVSGTTSVWASAAGAGARSHARLNEIATLYTAVAGMLNLLVIIDSSYRAGREATR